MLLGISFFGLTNVENSEWYSPPLNFTAAIYIISFLFESKPVVSKSNEINSSNPMSARILLIFK